MSTCYVGALQAAADGFETGLPLIPSGEFTSFAPYAKHSTQSANVRKLPVLRGKFDCARFDRHGPDVCCGYGAVRIGSVLALTFRLQSGPDALYWLANPADAEVWDVVDQWIAARRMVLAAEFGDTAYVMARDFYEPPVMRYVRQAVHAARTVTPAFVATVSTAVLKNELIEFVSSDLDNHPKLRSVQARMVRTSVTGDAAVMLDHGKMPENPDEAVASLLAEKMLQPQTTRR